MYFPALALKIHVPKSVFLSSTFGCVSELKYRTLVKEIKIILQRKAGLTITYFLF